MSSCAAVLAVFVASCAPENDESGRPDGGCEPSIRPGADAGGAISPDHPTCCFAVGVPETSGVIAIALADAPPGTGGDAGWWPDAGPNDAGPPPPAWVAAETVFASPTDARWVATTNGDGAALHVEVGGEPWTLAVEQSALVPDPPAGGLQVVVVADERGLTMTRRSDGSLLVAWIRARDEATCGRLDETTRAGDIQLALGTSCYGWRESGFWCGRGFLVYAIEVSSDGGARATVGPRATRTVELGGVPYAITNRLVSERGGGAAAECADCTHPVLDADVIIQSL